MSRSTAILVTLLGLCAPAGARAEPPGLADPPAPDPASLTTPPAFRDDPILRPLRLELIVAENLMVLVPPTIYYYATTNLQREDFELKWDWPSWRSKLTSVDDLVLDTGNWPSNALRHPLAGELSYQAVRAGGYGPLRATLVDAATSLFWEYVVEYRERMALNDIIVNTASGFLLGEPLFQIGRIADLPHAGWPRNALAWVASPFHRLHAALGYSSWRRLPAPWTRASLTLGGGVVDHRTAVRRELGLRLEVDLVNDARRGVPGSSRGWIRPGRWNRVVAELRADDGGLSRFEMQTRTTYGGRFVHQLDDARRGHDVLVDLAGGIDYDSRRLAYEWDRLAVFHLLGPRLTLERWSGGDQHVTLELGAAGDLAMISAHVFGPVPPFPLLPQNSVLQSRGYYYAGGLSALTRLSMHHGTWRGSLEGRAYQLWSIDGLDRHEMNGGPDDPHDVRDRRLYGRAAGSVELAAGVRLELAVEGVVRHGAWRDRTRQTTELDVDGGLAVGF